MRASVQQGRIPQRRRTRKITVGSVVTTLALSVLAGPSQNAGGRARP
ncbi:hypothetical protein [Streptomyces regalis]|nr:hypothetical protein [Streptomyces regalis]